MQLLPTLPAFSGDSQSNITEHLPAWSQCLPNRRCSEGFSFNSCYIWPEYGLIIRQTYLIGYQERDHATNAHHISSLDASCTFVLIMATLRHKFELISIHFFRCGHTLSSIAVSSEHHGYVEDAIKSTYLNAKYFD